MKELGIDVAGKIGPDLSAEPGRALGRLTDLGWGPRLRPLLSPADPASPADPGSDGPIPDDLVAAVVKVLAAWDWVHRPVGLITLPSRSRPQLIASLGQRMAEIGRMPYLGALTYADGTRPGARQYNSAQRLRALWHELEVPDRVRSAVASLDGPVLLVDDRIETGWTMTVATKLIREAGAAAVLPLALAVTSG